MGRVLLDTNILIHRETSRVVRQDIGPLFNWLDKLGLEKCVHPISLNEIRSHADPNIVSSFEAKLKSYHVLKTVAPDAPEISELREKRDKSENDQNDTTLLNEVFRGRVDAFITEDRGVHAKAFLLGIPEKVFTIDSYLEKVTTENPDLQSYKILSVRKEYFGNIDVSGEFFEPFHELYEGFSTWFSKKSDEIAYICESEEKEILAFLYLKVESGDEPYHDISPRFEPKKRLKIGTFRVKLNGHKIGERFIKIIFDNALIYEVDEIYVTIFNNNEERSRLVYLLADFGFSSFGVKATPTGEEQVLVRDFSRSVNTNNPRKTYPYFSAKTSKFIVPIYPAYHTELLPDSILNTESPKDFVENRPNRNAIRKVYISRSHERNLRTGDLIVFYRTKDGGPAFYTSVTTTIGVVESVTTDIKDQQHFIELCRKRSVFSDRELITHWNYYRNNHPFVVNFLYVCSFPKRLNLKTLNELEIIKDAPRGFERLTDEAFSRLMEASNGDTSLIVD